MDLTRGTRLGPYEIGSQLGAGGMGVVYRARDTKLQRDVALKVLPDIFATDPERLARFQREAQVLASLNHPNIAAIYGLEEADGIRALVLELVEGATLQEIIAGSGLWALGSGPARTSDQESEKQEPVPQSLKSKAQNRRPSGARTNGLPLGDALPIARQIAEALDAAHERGVVHRDLKPANVKVKADGTVKVLDFGLAKLVTSEAGDAGSVMSQAPTATAAGTRQGTVLGTPAYMSPEQARGQPVDKRTDIWAFGCVFYEMLTGRRAFSGETTSDTIAAILGREPDWAALPETTPAGIRRLLRRCFDKDPRRRMRDIGDAHVELDERPVLPDTASPREPTTERPARRLPAALWALLGLLAGGLILLVAIRFAVPPPSSDVTRLSVALPPDMRIGGMMALSPDGKVLVYSGVDDSGRRLYRRALDALESVPIEGTDDGVLPFFSPDGASIGFVADGSIAGAALLKTVPLRGGVATTIAKPAAGGGTWLADNTIVFGSGGGGLQRVPASGGEVRELTVPDRGDSHVRPVALPGGRAVIFTVHVGARDALRLEAVSLETGQRTPLTEGNGAHVLPTGHLAFERGGSLWVAPFDSDELRLTGPATPVVSGIAVTGYTTYSPVIAIGRDGSLAYGTGSFETFPARSLVWVDRTGREEAIDAPARAWWWPRISPDGRRLGLHIMDPVNMDAWIYELDHGPLVRLTYDPRQDGYPMWTPDGRRVVFWSRQGGARRNLYSRSADLLGGDERLTTSPNDQDPYSWAGDGKLLVFQEQSPTTGMDIGVVPLDGGRPAELLIRGPSDEAHPDVSPDGRWIAYQSKLSGQWEVYVQSFPDLQGRWQLSTEGGVSPVWGPDGRALFYRRGDAMMSVPVEATATSFRHGNPRVLFEAPYAPEDEMPSVGRGYALAPDGQRFLMLKAVEEGTAEVGSAVDQLVVVRRWSEELRRTLPD